MSAMHAVRVDAISASYGDGDQLRDVDLSLRAGELAAVLGPNGAGKSTLIRVIAGLLETTRGSVAIFGQAPSAQQIAVVPQRSEVALGFTVGEVVMMGRAPHQGRLMRETRLDRNAVSAAIEACSLRELVTRPVAELSGGEQKRVHIARALAQQAPILLLDEAAAHLDIRHAAALYALVRREVDARQLACLMTTHDLNAAAEHADRVVLLRNGRIVADGPPRDVMTAELVEQTFDVPVEVLADGRYFRALFR